MPRIPRSLFPMCVMLLGLSMTMTPQPAAALDQAHRAKAEAAIERGIEYLRSNQAEDGSWSPKPGPAVTALAATVMLDRPEIGTEDPHVVKAVDYILSKRRDDGGIHDGVLANYNTSISIAALARMNDNPDAAEAVQRGQAFLRGLQWNAQKVHDDGGEGDNAPQVDESHPFYGGAGYGGSGRPDMSNTQIMLQGLYESGMDCNDPIFQRAVTFINRCQGHESNEMFGDKIINDGGFIYATSINKELVGTPESKANPELMDEALKGAPVSGLRTYGSMTYAGFKSYLYAQMDRDDPRVVAAHDWISRNWTLDRNPGMPDKIQDHGLFYMYMTIGRAMRAWGSTTLETPDGTQHDWANELIDAVVARQRDDGSWVNDADRWMEGDPNLVTAYSLIALQNAIGESLR